MRHQDFSRARADSIVDRKSRKSPVEILWHNPIMTHGGLVRKPDEQVAIVKFQV